MDANFVIVCGMLVSFIFGGLTGWLSGFVTGQAAERQKAAEVRAVAFREGERAAFEAEARTQVARQSARLQAPMSDEARRRLERTYRGMERRQAHADGLVRAVNEVRG